MRIRIIKKFAEVCGDLIFGAEVLEVSKQYPVNNIPTTLEVGDLIFIVVDILDTLVKT